MADFILTPAREKQLEKIAQDLPDKSFKSLYGKDWKSVKMATAMNILKKKYGFKEETKMKFKDLREKMSGSKLTGAEISQYYRKNPGAKKAARDKNIKKAIELALDHGGAMNFAIKKIEKMKRGLADHPEVAKALEFANFGEEIMREALKEESIEEATDLYNKDGIQITRYAMGKGKGMGVQVNFDKKMSVPSTLFPDGGGYIKMDIKNLPKLLKAIQAASRAK